VTSPRDRDAPAPAAGGSLYRRLVAKARAECLPLQVVLELTTRCNLRCTHCYAAERPRGELSTEQMRDALDQFAAAGALFLTLTGGEPLVHPDFWTICEQARKRGFSITVFTNGTLIGPAEADRLLALQTERMEVSILGSTPATHDAITGRKGSFERTMRAVDLLIERGLRVQMKATWMRTNIAEARAVETLAREHGAAFRSGFLLMPTGPEGSRTDALRVTGDQVAALSDAWLESGWTGRPSQAALVPADPEKQANTIPCGAGQASCYVDCRGAVYPCVAIRRAAGSLLEQDFARIWQDSPVLREIRGIRLADLPDCRSCALFDLCPRCAGVADMESGSLLAKSPQACRIAEARRSMRRLPAEPEAKTGIRSTAKTCPPDVDNHREKNDDSPGWKRRAFISNVRTADGGPGIDR